LLVTYNIFRSYDTHFILILAVLSTFSALRKYQNVPLQGRNEGTKPIRYRANISTVGGWVYDGRVAGTGLLSWRLSVATYLTIETVIVRVGKRFDWSTQNGSAGISRRLSSNWANLVFTQNRFSCA